MNPSCDGKQMLEFPIFPLAYGLYQGGDPWTDRVVFFWYGNGLEDGSHCATVTHSGVPNNGFALCRSRD